MHMLHSSISKWSIVQLQHLPIFIRDRAASPAASQTGVNKTGEAHKTELRTNMAYYTGNRTQHQTLAQRFADLRSKAAEAYANWRVYRVTLNELQGLSMRELADLGINPSMIKRIALEAAYGKTA